MTIADIPAQLAREFKQLGQARPGDTAQPVATFSAKPWEAYTLVATMQAASRHPGLSDTQREVVLGFAHQVADQLVAMCRALLGPDSAIETTTNMGFDPQFDARADPNCATCGGSGVEPHSWPAVACGCIKPPQEALDPDYGPEDNWDDVDDEDDSHILGERRISYVQPTWIHLSTDPEDADLLKCAKCSRFFVQNVPIRLFQDLGDDVVLGMEVCEACAPSVVSKMQR